MLFLMSLAVMVLCLMLFPLGAAAKGGYTVKQQLAWLHRRWKVNFVYDAQTIDVSHVYQGTPISKMTLDEAVESLFRGTNIRAERSGKYIILRAIQNSKFKIQNEENGRKAEDRRPETKDRRRYTLSGYVRDETGETLINATVYDLTTRQGTVTNAYGFYSITLPEGDHRLRVSYLGYGDNVQTISLLGDVSHNFDLQASNQLQEVVVEGDRNSPLLNTQTGKRSLSQRDIKTEFALMSAPDVVKTLQRTSGVAEGVELASGLYVHGGNNDENLYMIDGTPLYQVNHTLGLFSAFNADVVKNVDFYKSGFPARYGGRLSSVVDVRTEDGDFYHTHGSYRIGLLDGSFQIDGPIARGRTSYNIGLRRSWLDLVARPIFAIVNHGKNEQFTLGYQFQDLNAKVTHIFNPRSKIYLSIYSGADRFKGDSEDKWGDDDWQDIEKCKTHLNWGNLNAAVNWNYVFSPKLFANFTAVYSYNRSKYDTEDIDHVYHDKREEQVNGTRHGYHSTINDAGVRSAFDYRPSVRHHIRFGADYTLHNFHPQTQRSTYYYYNDNRNDTQSSHSQNRHTSHEVRLYAEDEVTLSDHWSVNGGFNTGLFSIGAKQFYDLDPRLAMKYQVSPSMSLKLSYTKMTQYVHKIANSYLDLPTDYWVPTTERLRPMRSQQIAAGIYRQLGHGWFASLEGYYKWSDHLLQYSNWIGLEPPAEHWDRDVMDGQGRFYGAELDVSYRSKRMELAGSYTLSWNKRKYPEFYDQWYYDKFDSRHKLNLSARLQLSRKVSFFALWTMHTGYRFSFPKQYAYLPDTPEPEDGGNYHYQERDFIYEVPNNVRLPLFHRLDLGFDFHHQTRHGHEIVWNLSLYNVYCHLNAWWVDTKYNDNTGLFTFKTRGYIPIIPSVSYTYKF